MKGDDATAFSEPSPPSALSGSPGSARRGSQRRVRGPGLVKEEDDGDGEAVAYDLPPGLAGLPPPKMKSPKSHKPGKSLAVRSQSAHLTEAERFRAFELLDEYAKAHNGNLHGGKAHVAKALGVSGTTMTRVYKDWMERGGGPLAGAGFNDSASESADFDSREGSLPPRKRARDSPERKMGGGAPAATAARAQEYSYDASYDSSYDSSYASWQNSPMQSASNLSGHYQQQQHHGQQHQHHPFQSPYYQGGQGYQSYPPAAQAQQAHLLQQAHAQAQAQATQQPAVPSQRPSYDATANGYPAMNPPMPPDYLAAYGQSAGVYPSMYDTPPQVQLSQPQQQATPGLASWGMDQTLLQPTVKDEAGAPEEEDEADYGPLLPPDDLLPDTKPDDCDEICHRGAFVNLLCQHLDEQPLGRVYAEYMILLAKRRETPESPGGGFNPNEIYHVCNSPCFRDFVVPEDMELTSEAFEMQCPVVYRLLQKISFTASSLHQFSTPDGLCSLLDLFPRMPLPNEPTTRFRVERSASHVVRWHIASPHDPARMDYKEYLRVLYGAFCMRMASVCGERVRVRVGRRVPGTSRFSVEFRYPRERYGRAGQGAGMGEGVMDGMGSTGFGAFGGELMEGFGGGMV